MIRFRRPRSPVHALRRALAGLLVVAAGVLALRGPGVAAERGVGARTVPVAVAAADLPGGTVLAAGDLRTATFPSSLVPAGAARDPGVLTGRLLASGVRAGEPVTDVRLVGAGLTALLAPGEVAVPVRPADLAVAGLVRPGDRVDVLAATENAQQAETVAVGALVLAAPAATARSPAGPSAAAGSEGLLLLAVDGDTAARLAAASAGATLTVTLTRS